MNLLKKVYVATIGASFVATLLLTPDTAFSHSNFVRSEPVPNSVLSHPPERLTIWFTEQLEPSRSYIQILNSTGQRVDNDDSTVDANDTTIISVTLMPQLPEGIYTVGWKTLSTIDGHTIRGSFVFFVGDSVSKSEPIDLPQTSLIQSPIEPFARWMGLTGLLAVLGSLLFVMTVLRPSTPRDTVNQFDTCIDWLLIGGTCIALAGSILALIVQASAAYEVSFFKAIGEPISFVLGNTDWGIAWSQRLWLLLALGTIVTTNAIKHRRGKTRNKYLPVVGAIAAGLALLTISKTSQAAAISSIWLPATITDFIHVLAASFWIGGLFSLALTASVSYFTMDPAPRQALLTAILPRFSVIAGVSVGLLVITGLFSAWAQVAIIPALGTPYGLTLLGKSTLTGLLISLGAINLIWITPAVRKHPGATKWLTRIVVVEALIGVFVMLTVGYLTSLEPARQVAAREAISTSKTLEFKDTVEGTEISLEIVPGTIGSNRIAASLRDRQGNAVTNATGVDIRISYLAADFGEPYLKAEHVGKGSYIVEDGKFNIEGAYQIELAVRRPDAFDARTAFRFSIPGIGSSKSSILTPDPGTGILLLGVELGAIGILLLAFGIPLGGWYSYRGLSFMTPGVAVAVIGSVIIVNAQLAEPSKTERNPFPPDQASLTIGSTVYTEKCQTCHGISGKGDGPSSEALNPSPADLVVHVPLHPDMILFSFIHDGIKGTSMAGLGNSLTDDQIWHVINYIRTLE